MFDFTKETIINSMSVEGTSLARVTGANSLLRVLRCADYKKDNIVGQKVYKNVYLAGSLGSVQINLDSLTSAAVYKIAINLKTSNAEYLADYATYINTFQKPVYAEFTATGTKATDIASAKKVLMSAIPENYRFLTITTYADGVVITCTDKSQRFANVTLSKLIVNSTLPSESDYELVANKVNALVQSVDEFGTYNWLVHNLRFPSYPNIRHNAQNEEEYPIKGGLYNQYSFQYSTERSITGLGAVGQKMESVTTHIFYVLSTLCTAFEAAVEAAGLTINTIGQVFTVAATATGVLTIDIAVTAINPAIDLTDISATSDNADITIGTIATTGTTATVPVSSVGAETGNITITIGGLSKVVAVTISAT